MDEAGPDALSAPVLVIGWQIAQLAGTGLTNKQIGERLHLPPRTVATHLYQTGGPVEAGYARLSSSTGMVRTPAVWRAYSANPG